MIRVVLPAHLRNLAQIEGEVKLEVEGPLTQRSVLDALEERYPMLRGTIRDQVTHQRRPFVRFFACEQDVSHKSADAPLPDAVAKGAEPLLVVGAIAGGSTGNIKSYNQAMPDVIEILKSSGPMTLDELNLRTSVSPADLASSLAGLQKTGQVSVVGPHAERLASLSDDQIQDASDVVVELTQVGNARLNP